MKKCYISLLCLFLVVYILFVPLLFNIHQYLIHLKNWNLTEQKIKSDNVIYLKIDSKSFDAAAINQKKEIILNNHLYDIIEYSIKKNTVKLKLLLDDDEEQLISKLKKFLFILKKLNLSSFIFLFNAQFNTMTSLCEKLNYTIHTFIMPTNFNLLSVFIKVSLPPPEFV